MRIVDFVWYNTWVRYNNSTENQRWYMSIRFSFDYRKATQALNYFAIKEGGRINKMKALKLIFLADRYHLRKYGRLITNDNYLAMQHGPVPSVTKDIAESNDYLNDESKDYSIEYIEPINNLNLSSIKNVDKGVFSETDIEALQFSWDAFGHYDQFQLRDITHSYPEWAKYKKRITIGSCYPINVLDFLKDPVESVDKSLKLKEKDHKMFALSSEDRDIKKETLTERSFIESLWR